MNPWREWQRFKLYLRKNWFRDDTGILDHFTYHFLMFASEIVPRWLSHGVGIALCILMAGAAIYAVKVLVLR